MQRHFFFNIIEDLLICFKNFINDKTYYISLLIYQITTLKNAYPQQFAMIKTLEVLVKIIITSYFSIYFNSFSEVKQVLRLEYR